MEILGHCDGAEGDGESNKWIVIVDGKVVSGERMDEVGKEAERKYPNEKIALAKIPEGNTLIL